jgi:hypothetical protein
MSRSGYTDIGWESREDQWAYIRYRGALNSAIKGKKGQAFLKELLAALDAMPEKKLVAWELESDDGAHCALGVVGANRGIPLKDIDPEDYEAVAKQFGIPESLAREIVFENDDGFYGFREDSPEGRWRYMRNWVQSQIRNSITSSEQTE